MKEAEEEGKEMKIRDGGSFVLFFKILRAKGNTNTWRSSPCPENKSGHILWFTESYARVMKLSIEIAF